jgi:putative glutamine amidotransferase
MKPRIAIPIPTSFDSAYNDRSWPAYAQAVERSGGEPVAVPLDAPPAATARLIATCSAVLLPGSGADVNTHKYGEETSSDSAPADAARENVDELLLQDAHNMGKPIFTVCFGTQMLNVWRGGSLVQHIPAGPVEHRRKGVVNAHEATIAPDSLLADIVAVEAKPSNLEPRALSFRSAAEESASLSNHEPRTTTLPINSSHHQAIATAGDGLRISARSPEDGVVEAIENTPEGTGGPFVLGVQWHPERTYDESPASRALFTRFVAAAAAWSPKPPA